MMAKDSIFSTGAAADSCLEWNVSVSGGCWTQRSPARCRIASREQMQKAALQGAETALFLPPPSSLVPSPASLPLPQRHTRTPPPTPRVLSPSLCSLSPAQPRPCWGLLAWPKTRWPSVVEPQWGWLGSPTLARPLVGLLLPQTQQQQEPGCTWGMGW